MLVRMMACAILSLRSIANTGMALYQLSSMEVAMLIRSMLLMCAVAAVGCVDASNATDDSTGTVSQKTSGGGGFVCLNKDTIQGVGCVGSIAVLPINVDIHDVGNLDNSQLNV